MAFFRFWWDCVIWAFWRWERGDAVTTPLMPIIVNVVSWVGLLGLAGNLTPSEVGSIIGKISLGLLLLIVFLVAPYGRWKEQKR